MRFTITKTPIARLQQYDNDAQALALTNFRGALCKQFSEPLPQECRNTNGATGVSVLSVTLLAGAVAALMSTKMA